MADVTIRPVATARDMKRFVRMAWDIYRGDPNWVPPLMMDLMKRMNPRKNPFFKKADVAYFLAERAGSAVGRVAAIRNGHHNEYHNDKVGFFGFFECENDQKTADGLFEAAAAWLAGQGLDAMRGPANYSENDEYGLLVDGFDRPPVAIMPYNPAYYVDLIEAAGLAKAKDLYAWYVDHFLINIPPKVEKIVDRVRQKSGVTIRDINPKDVEGELQRIKTVYNDAWSDNWGFLPWTDDLLAYMAPDFKMIIIPELVQMAEVGGEPAGFNLVFPNVNEVIQRIGGRLFPFGWIDLLLNRKKTKGMRIAVMGIRKKFRIRGLEALFYVETIRRGTRLGFEFCEMSWVLEDNDTMNKAIEGFGAKRYKTYRIFEKGIKAGT